jgi:hypothetical protein
MVLLLNEQSFLAVPNLFGSVFSHNSNIKECCPQQIVLFFQLLLNCKHINFNCYQSNSKCAPRYYTYTDKNCQLCKVIHIFSAPKLKKRWLEIFLFHIFTFAYTQSAVAYQPVIMQFTIYNEINFLYRNYQSNHVTAAPRFCIIFICRWFAFVPLSYPGPLVVDRKLKQTNTWQKK